jgi:subtilisin family serine protease
MFGGHMRLSLIDAGWILVVSLALQAAGLAQPFDRDDGSPRRRGLTPDSDRGLVSLIIELDDEPLAAYRGHIAGLAPTHRESTGAMRLDVRTSASQMYLSYLAQQQRAFEAMLLGAVPSAQIIHRFQISFHGMSVLLPETFVDVVRRLPGVKAVYLDTLQRPTTERSPQFIGADHLWQLLGGSGTAGEGIVVGILDTGIWPEHPSFADPDPSGKPYATLVSWAGFCEAPSDSSAPLTCNNKLIGARKFLETYKGLIGLSAGELDSPRDTVGHGTHTASTAAGNFGVSSDIFGVPRGTVSGIAPRAHVAAYRICAQEGCFSSDSIAAVEQAVSDGVDVINFSISGGIHPYADALELSFLGAYAAGVFVAASAGNDGPAPDTVSHRGGWVTTVAASTTDRHFLSHIMLAASDGASLMLTGASVTGGIALPTPVVHATDFGDELCQNPFPGGTFTGVIVVCQRGGDVARVVKSFNVAAGGAAGLFLYNPVPQGLATDNHFIPTVHLENDDGATLLSFLASHAGVTATFTQGTAAQVQGDVMAAFSSRGGPEHGLGLSKPDVTAPGVQTLAGHTPQPPAVEGGLPGELFQAIQGTSMSSPHVAGAAASLKALWPGWTPAQIQSALMTTATVENMVKEDGATPIDPFDAGSGRIDLNRAANPGLTFHASDRDFLTHREALWLVNYPSLYVPALSGSITVPRTVRSELAEPGLWRLEVTAPANLMVTVPRRLFVLPGRSKTFTITLDATFVRSGAVRHAHLHLTRGNTRLTFPITVVRP